MAKSSIIVVIIYTCILLRKAWMHSRNGLSLDFCPSICNIDLKGDKRRNLSEHGYPVEIIVTSILTEICTNNSNISKQV